MWRNIEADRETNIDGFDNDGCKIVENFVIDISAEPGRCKEIDIDKLTGWSTIAAVEDATVIDALV